MKKKLAILTMSLSVVFSGVSYAFADSEVIHTPGKLANIVVFAKFKDQSTNEFTSTVDGSSTMDRITRSYKRYVEYMKSVSDGKLSVVVEFPQVDKATGQPSVINLDISSEDAKNKYIDAEVLNNLIPKLDIPKNINMDYNNDGYIDNLTVVLQGNVNRTNPPNTLWPHSSSYLGGNGAIINGKKLRNFNFLSSGQLNFSGAGLISHEFFHSLGYPDLYSSDPSQNPVRYWGIMAMNSSYLRYPLSYLRYKLSGWIDIPVIYSNQKSVKIYPQQMSKDGKNTAYIISSPIDPSQIFVVEMRQKAQNTEDIDFDIGGTGLVVYRVDTTNKSISNYEDKPNTVYIFRDYPQANSSVNELDKLYNAYLDGKNRTYIGSHSKDATQNQGALTYLDGRNSEIVISNVTSPAEDGSMTFDVSIPSVDGMNIEDRIYGDDRIKTSVVLSEKSFDSADSVVLVGTSKNIDALSAGALAKKMNAPIMYSSRDQISESVIKEMERLGAKNITIVGGNASISDGVVKTLREKGYTVRRISGDDRYQTSAKIADMVGFQDGSERKAFLVSGENYFDALSISAYSAKNEIPILLTSKRNLPNSISDSIKSNKIGQITIIGGTSSVPTSVVDKVKNISIDGKGVSANTRIAGDNRYQTSAKIANEYFSNSKVAYLASGQNPADALVIGSIAGKNNSPILLTKVGVIPDEMKPLVKKYRIIIVGGSDTVGF